MKSKQKLDEIFHLDKCPFTFQELPETSVPNSMKASLEWKSLDLSGTTSTQQEKRWIGDSEGHHCLCVCFYCLQRRLFFFFFLQCHLHRSKKGLHCLYMQAPVNDHCVEALITIPFELPTLLFFHGLKLDSKENKSVMDILWLSDYVKRICSCILLVMVNGRALAGLRKEQEAANWAESEPCYTDIDGLYSLLRVAMFDINRAHIKAQFLCKCTQMLSWEHCLNPKIIYKMTCNYSNPTPFLLHPYLVKNDTDATTGVTLPEVV